MAASAVLLILGIAGKDPVWAVTCIALAMGALGATESFFWVTGVELGRRHGGLSAAILNTGGNAGGIPAPYLTPWISAQYGWQIGLGLASVLVLIGAVLWCWIGPGGETASTADNQPEPSTFGSRIASAPAWAMATRSAWPQGVSRPLTRATSSRQP